MKLEGTNFEEGEEVGIEDFSLVDAIFIFGQPIVEAYYRAVNNKEESHFVVSEVKTNKDQIEVTLRRI